MDPLSLTTGVFALLGACVTASRTLKKIGDLRRAPELVQAVNNEISDLHLMIIDMSDRFERFKRNCSTIPRVDRAISQLCTSTLDQTRDKVLEIETLIQYQLLKPENEHLTVNKRAYLRHHGKLVKLHTELRDFRQRIANIFSHFEVRDISRVEVVFNDIRSNDLQILMQGQAKIQQTLDRMGLQSNVSNASVTLTSDGSLQTPHGFEHTSIQVSVSQLASYTSCENRTCSCQKNSVHLQGFLGTLFLGYAAMPVRRQGQQLCPTHCKRGLCATYLFPSWLLSYIVFVKMQFGTQGISRFSLSLIQTISIEHVVWDMVNVGELEGIENLFKSGQLTVTAQDPTGKTLLDEAIMSGNATVARFLIEMGADIFYESPRLQYSAQAHVWRLILAGVRSSKWVDSMKALFPEPDLEELFGFSSLHKAILGLENQPVESCLRLEMAQINETDSLGMTALLWAVSQGDAKSTGQLLFHGADHKKTANNGVTPLIVASQRSAECVRLLIAANVDIYAGLICSRFTPLHATVQSNIPEDEIIQIADILVCAGSDINVTTSFGNSPLTHACQSDYPKLMRWLLEHGADSGLCDTYGNNTLCRATRRNNHSQMNVLLQEYQQDHTKHLAQFGTFMHFVAACADTKSLRLLIEGRLAHRNINIKNDGGLTPVQVALLRRNVDVEWKDAFFTFLRTIDEDINAELDSSQMLGHQRRQPSPTLSENPDHEHDRAESVHSGDSDQSGQSGQSCLIPTECNGSLRERVAVREDENSNDDFVDALERQA